MESKYPAHRLLAEKSDSLRFLTGCFPGDVTLNFKELVAEFDQLAEENKRLREAAIKANNAIAAMSCFVNYQGQLGEMAEYAERQATAALEQALSNKENKDLN